jgi:hypothetical protein
VTVAHESERNPPARGIFFCRLFAWQRRSGSKLLEGSSPSPLKPCSRQDLSL